MAQEQSIEAARTRIQRLVEEIALLSKKELRSEEFFEQFLTRVVQATDAKGGAVWLVGKASGDGKYEFQLAAQIEFEASLFQTDEQQRANVLRILSEVVHTRRPLIFAPLNAPAKAEPGSLEAQLAQMQPAAPAPDGNRSPYPFVQVPLFLKEQVLGVLQVWLQPYVTAQNYPEFATFLQSLATYVEQHFQSRRLGTLVVETQLLQHLLKFSTDLAGSLDSLEVARLAANYGRDLIGCERCSVLTLDGDRWKVLAISGQETVEKKSSMVKAMAAFVGAHAAPETVVLSKKELLARAEAAQAGGNGEKHANGVELSPAVRRTDGIDLAYFQLSHVVSAAVAPLLDPEKQLVGAYFAESTTEGFFEAPPGVKEAPVANRITEWLANHTSRSLRAAQDYETLPFRRVASRLRGARLLLTGRNKRRSLVRLVSFATVIVAILLYPKMDRVEGDCSLLPMKRSAVVPEVPGRVERVLVREGAHVQKGAPIAQLDTRRMETELATNEQEKRRLYAEAERHRGLGDEGSANVAYLSARVAEETEKKLQADIAAATLRSAIDGVILTKDLELRQGEFIQPGTPFAEVAALDQWEVQIDVNEKEIGKVEKAVPPSGGGEPKHVHFILYSQSAHKLHGLLARHEQISAAAYPREDQNVFVVTLQNITIPPELQPAMRPGLTGRAKIDLERRPLVQLLARRVWKWFQLRLIG